MKKTLAALSAFIIALPIFSGGDMEFTPVSLQAKQELSAKSTIERSVSISSMLYSLGNLYSFLDTYFLGEIDNKAMEEELVSAMIDSLGDEYSYYIPSSSTEEFEEFSEGSYIGLGLYLTKMNPSYIDMEDPRSYMIIIQSPFPGGPADRAGLRPNDMISHINGEDVSQLNAVDASKKLRGTPGEDITITVHRGDAVFDVTLRPERVTNPSTSATMLSGNIGYIRIYSFSQTTADSFSQDLEGLIADGIDSLIIDLRNNGGGIIDSATRIADLFLDDGVILKIRFKEGSGRKETIINATRGTAVPLDMPIAILINGGTASSSEILTGALSDNDRAITVGSKTFGKGISQEVRPFSEGYVQITTGHFYTPSDSDIHHIGISPDIPVEEEEFNEDDMKAYSQFLNDNDIDDFISANPDYNYGNVEKFVDENSESGVPSSLLELLIRNEYIYRMDWDDRPVAEPEYDEALTKAMEALN